MLSEIDTSKCADFEGRWIHFITTTYGAWLPGDPRGFRTRHHREHVEGDYKNPPPAGAHAGKLHRSLQLLKQPPVRLSKVWRPRIGAWVRKRIVMQDAFVLCLAVSAQHLHVLTKLRMSVKTRDVMGLAKKHAIIEAKNIGWQGKLWGLRGKEVRVKDRDHQLQVYRYILAHEAQGAWTWDWMQERE